MLEWSRKVVELVTLALAEFTHLSEAELKMLCAAAEGDVAYCGTDPHDSEHQYLNDPELATVYWGPERDIRSGLIR
jgi:hypothetical protein